MRQWNIQQLNIERIKDLAKCQSQDERNMCDSICRTEIVTLARSRSKLSPCDLTIIDQLGLTSAVSA